MRVRHRSTGLLTRVKPADNKPLNCQDQFYINQLAALNIVQLQATDHSVDIQL